MTTSHAFGRGVLIFIPHSPYETCFAPSRVVLRRPSGADFALRTARETQEASECLLICTMSGSTLFRIMKMGNPRLIWRNGGY